MTSEQFPILILLFPFFMAFAVCLAGLKNKKFCWPLSVFAMAMSVFFAWRTLLLVKASKSGFLEYHLSGWRQSEPVIGIIYRIDSLNALVLLLISIVGLLTIIYAKRDIDVKMPGKALYFYTLFLLLVTGLMGMTITADAFNLYVLLEISSLTTYGLIAIGKGRAAHACFNYIIMGTVGATFLLLGIGYLYIKTGTLNMHEIYSSINPADPAEGVQNLKESSSIIIAFVLMLIGLFIKMAFFPLHGWLPNAYSFAPTSSANILAPLMTKVTIYIMVRMMFSIFGADFVFNYLFLDKIIVTLAVICILAGSFYALAQTDLKKMLCYLIIAEVGYMVGGVWLNTGDGLRGALYHIISDGFMTLCLFLAAGMIISKTKSSSLESLYGIYKKMPVTMLGFTIAAFSMIGIPPTCGFFSKWYLIRGAMQAGQFHYIIALLISSLVNAVLFFRIIEKGYFGKLPEGDDDHGHHHDKKVEVDEAPTTMILPLLLCAAALILIGIFNNEIIKILNEFISTSGVANA